MRSRPLSRAVLAVALIAAAPTLGCTLISAVLTSPSDSIAASSRSISGSFDAISGSSSGKSGATSNKQIYSRDLRAFTAVFASSQGSREDFLRGVARIAEDHGMTHWEADSSTPLAIGQGLRDARWSEAQMAEFLDEVGRDKPSAQLALEGYRQAGG